MEQKRVTPDFSVSPQIAAADMDAIVKAGFCSIVCNRPDGEGADQSTFEEIEAAAKAKGLEQPVVSGKVRDEDTKNFAALIAELPKPTLGFCRTGTRSMTLWSLAEGAKRPLPEILQ